MVGTKETEKVVIAKPVAYRPSFSNLKSFSKCLAGTDTASPSSALPEAAVAVIQPRTVRLKPVSSSSLVQHELLGSATCEPNEKVTNSKPTNNAVYKPIAKLVSKTAGSLLTDLGGNGVIPSQEIADIAGPIQPSSQVENETNLISHFHPIFSRKADKKANALLGNCEDGNKSLLLPCNRDPSYDGHNWRKYGQKQVKGSEYPRSYYKCTHANCPVKKKVEKMLDGQIAEIIYNGEHNHSKPQPLNNTHIPEGHGEKTGYDATTNEVKNPSWKNQQAEEVKGNNGISQDHNHIGASAPPVNTPMGATTCNTSISISNGSLSRNGELNECLEVEGDDFKTKRRKKKQSVTANDVKEASSETHAVVRNITDTDIVGNGFRWRKYGQKVVKGNPYPRSYYRCTTPKCNVRKYVERTSDDPDSFLTTYEGRHNHGLPVASTQE